MNKNLEKETNSNEESKEQKMNYSYKLIDTVNQNSITIIWSKTNEEFKDWMSSKNVEEILLEINEACSSSI